MEDKLEMLIKDHTRLFNENQILKSEIDRLNQVVAEVTKKLKEGIKDKN